MLFFPVISYKTSVEMKRFLLSASLLAAVSLAGAQVRMVEISSNARQKAIDSVVYRITYNAKTIDDTTRTDKKGRYEYAEDMMRLDIGHHANCFYNYTEMYADSLLHAAYDKSHDLRGMKRVKSTISWEIYQNYPEGQTTCLDKVWTNKYRITETTQLPQWNIVADSTARILGYNCTLATTHYKGRTWRAWFTEDIPLPYGPWKLCGLPGLVLRAADTSRQFIFDAIGMRQMDGTQPILLKKHYDKYEPVSQKTFDKVRRETTPGEAFAIKGVTIGTSDPEIDKAIQNALKKVTPYNPIEVIR